MELEGKWVRAFGGVAAQSVLIPQMNAAEITFLPMRLKCLVNKDGTIFQIIGFYAVFLYRDSTPTGFKKGLFEADRLWASTPQ